MQQKKTTKEEYQKCVNVVVEYIIQHLGEDIDLKSLARISNFSPFYFHRIMKAFLGEPIGTFIVRTRTEAAARLLCNYETSDYQARPGTKKRDQKCLGTECDLYPPYRRLQTE